MVPLTTTSVHIWQPTCSRTLRTDVCAVGSRPDVAWAYALRFQNLAAEHHLARHARRVEGSRRHRAVRVGLDLDHFYPIFSDPAGPCLEGWITLTALAQATSRLRLGTLVTGIHYRHPAVLANMAATLDVVSGGRLELGIGAGWNEEESGAYGIELGSAGQRSDRFEEACEVIVGLLTQQTTRLSPASTTSSPTRARAQAGQRPTRRSASAAAASGGRCAPPPGSPSTGTSSVARRRSSPASVTSFMRTARTSAATRRRSCLSSHVLFAGDAKATAEQAAALAEVGAELGIVSLPPPLDPGVLEPLATALREL